MYLNKIIIPPVNNKITAYVIHILTESLITIPILNLNTTNQIIKKVGLEVNKQDTIPILKKNKNLNIKII